LAADIILINPPRLRQITKRPSRTREPHLGLAYIAGVLIEKGFRVKMLDGDACRSSLADIVRQVETEDPLLVGLTAPTTLVKSAASIAKQLKEANPDRKIAIGGYHATALPRETLLEFPAFDFAVFHEGENPISNLVRALATGEKPTNTCGLCWRENSTIRMGQVNPGFADLDSLPLPAWELFPLDRYQAHYRKDQRVRELPINLGRGCPGQCTFCARVNGEKVRRRSAESVLAEIEYDVDRFGAGAIVFMDETFAANAERSVQICEGMIRRGLNRKVYWLCQTRVDSLDKPLLELMARAGCKHIALGIESGDQEILRQARKPIDFSRAASVIRHAREAKIFIDNFFLLGLPGETANSLHRTRNLSVRLDSDFANFFLLVPYPGTEIYQQAIRRENGLVLMTKDWDAYGIQIGRSLELATLNRSRLERAQLTAYLRFYLRPNKIRNLLSMVDWKVMPVYFWNMLGGLLRHALGRKGKP